jgi:predicted metalloprotease
MKTEGRRESTNVEDRRRKAIRNVGIGGGLIGLLFLLGYAMMGGNPQRAVDMMEEMEAAAPQPAAEAQFSEAEEAMAKFVRVVLADTEDVWKELFAAEQLRYREPTLVLFTQQVPSACGYATAATGPFYCPLDGKVYLDLSFFEQMKRRFNAPGDFAQAYVVAHEIGHHVQNLLGITDQVQALRPRLSTTQYNQLSVRLELQADYLAGVWAHHAQKNWRVLEEGDIKEAINAATAIGDDRLQRQTQGFVVPESFTHGTSEQRVRWFYKGLQSGEMLGGNTFEARRL